MRKKAKSLLRLFCFEWKKQLFRPSVWVAVVLLTIINTVQLASVFETKSLLSPSYTDAKWEPIYRALYEDFSGTIIKEKIERLMAIYRPLEIKTADLTAATRTDDPSTYTGNLYSDRLFFKWCFVEPMEYAYLYQSYAEGVVAQARENAALYQSLGNRYEAEKNAQIARLFEGRRMDGFVYTEPYQYLLGYDVSAIFVLLLVIYSLCGVFAFEKESGMGHLLPTVCHGGGMTVAAKLLSGFVFTTGINLWFLIADTVGIRCSFGTLVGSDSPLYVLEGFENTPLRCTLGQYLLLAALLRLLGAWAIGLLVLAVSRLFESTLLPLSLGTTATLGLFFLHQTYSGSAQLWLRVLNSFSLIYSKELFLRAEFINFLGEAIPLSLAAILFTLAWIVGLSIYFISPHRKKKRNIGRGG